MKRTLALLALGLTGGACTLLVPVDLDQCTTDTDCTAKGWSGATCSHGACVNSSAISSDAGGDTSADAGIPPGPWGCVGHVKWPIDTTGEKRKIRNKILDISEQPVTSVVLIACGKLDPECTRPITTEPVTTGADGVFTLVLPRGFDGFVKATPPAPMLPALIFSPPLYEDLDTVATGGEPLHAVSKADIDALLALVGASVDDTAGHLFAQNLDCEDHLASGVSLSLSVKGPTTKPYYYAGGLPNTDVLTTDGSGLGGFVNVPPGNVVLTARNTLGQLYATRQVVVKAKTVTYLTNAPSP